MNVHYDSDPESKPFSSRYPKHQYWGLTQVNRIFRFEFGPLYNEGRNVHLSELGRFLRSGLAGENGYYSRLLPLLSVLEGLPAKRDLDVSPLFELGPSIGTIAPGGWYLNTKYNGRHDDSLAIRVLCRMLACLQKWRYLMEQDFIDRIFLSRHGTAIKRTSVLLWSWMRRLVWRTMTGVSRCAFRMLLWCLSSWGGLSMGWIGRGIQGGRRDLRRG